MHITLMLQGGAGDTPSTAALGLSVALTAVAACSTADEAPPPAATAAVRLEQVSTIGCIECGTAEQLTVFTLAMSREGRVWTLDTFEPLVRGFDRNGELLQTFGVKGQGPGEIAGGGADVFVPAIALYPLDDGSILLHELQGGLMRFSVDGTYLGTIPIEAEGRRFPRGTAYHPARRSAFVLTLGLGQGGTMAVQRLDIPEIGPVTPVEILTGPERLPRRQDDPEQVLGTFPIAAAPDGGLAVGDPLRYRISTFAADGEPLATFGRDTERPRKSERQLREERDLALRRGRDVSEIDELLPHFEATALAYDDAGRLWVWTTRGGADATIFDVFDAGGRYLAEVPLDEPLKRGSRASFTIAGGRLAAVVVHESGNDLIRMWRIVEP